MLRYINNPIAARNMNARDALHVALFYDKYEFVEGGQLCDQVMADYFKLVNVEEEKFTLDLEFIIELVNVAHTANLDSAFKVGIIYIWNMLKRTDTPYGRMMFTEDHLTKLAPLLKYSDDNRDRIGLEFQVGLLNEDFPKEFVSKCKSEDECDTLNRCISHIQLSGTNISKADGSFVRDRPCWDCYIFPENDERAVVLGGQRITFEIQYLSDDDIFEGWSIVKILTPMLEDGERDYDNQRKKKIWIAPYSKNRKRPPLRGWVSSYPLAKGNPTIKYMLRESIE